MADLVMGAMGTLIPKLYKLLKEDYMQQTGVKERISFLTKELEGAQAALCKVAQVPWDQLDKQVQLWAREVREASYDMEDVLDAFLVRVQGPDSTEQEESLLKPLKKMVNLFKASKARRKISGDVKDIMTHLQEVTERCHRYKVEDIVARPETTSTIDPRLHAMFNKVKNLVGINKSSGELISMLQPLQPDDASKMKKKIVSVVGVGGLGKTTLAKVVYDKFKGDFACGAFVPVGRNPDFKKIFKDILMDLNKQRYLQVSTTVLAEWQLINELRSFLHENKRYLIVIDDIWEVESWETIKLGMDDDNDSGGRIIITTRKLEVAMKADEVYKLQPLNYDSSRELFLTRIPGKEGKYIHNQLDEISDKFIRKCGGIPLAITTMASLLAGKPRDKWSELYNTIDFVSKDNKEAENTMRILSFSYYDLPSHLRTCLLYLSAFPEDSVVLKDSLVWMWVAEGFVHKKEGMRLFEIGEGYFNDLINRSMIQAQEHKFDDTIIVGCRVHDIVLDFIHSMSREENFFNILENDQDTLLQSNVRRLANHNRTNGHIHQGNHIEMPKLRSFIALGFVIKTWAPPSSFTLLRVLAIENYKATKRLGTYYYDSRVRVEHLGYLLHLRFLSLRGTEISRIPEGIGALRFLQMLDLLGCYISELPASGSLPKRLACLRITLEDDALDGSKVFSVEEMTSLEELTIEVPHGISNKRKLWWPVKSLGSLRELRVLNIIHISWDEEGRRDFVESLRHLHGLQRLIIESGVESFVRTPKWQATDLVLQHHLRLLSVEEICFSKLPSCIDPSCMPNLSHLDLMLEHLDEEDLKILGGLPELHYLSLDLQLLSRPATIHNISDSNACYFPKLRRFKLGRSMFSFVANKDDKRVSFHIWNAEDNTSMPSVSDDEFRSPRPSVSDDELKSDDEMQRMQSPMPFVSHDEELHRPLKSSKLQQGLAAVAFYFHAFLLHVLAYVKRWPLKLMELMGQHHPLHCNHASFPGNGNGEEPTAKPSVSDDKNKGSTICSKGAAAAAPRFMPSLQVLDFHLHYMDGIPNWVHNLCWEYLPSLREINAEIYLNLCFNNILETELRRATEVHPNQPTLHMKNSCPY